MAYLIADYVIERLMQQNVEALFGVPAVYGAELFAAAARANTPARSSAPSSTAATSNPVMPQTVTRGCAACPRCRCPTASVP